MSTTRIIHYDDLPQGGFAGIMERRMVMNPDAFPMARGREDISHGLGDFIYLSFGQFLPNDGAPMHPHAEVDIVSVVFNGSIGHKGTLGDGTEIYAPEVQVQRAGTGMQHAEFNLGDTPAEFAQIWFKPPQQRLAPAYRNFKLSENHMTTVLGGDDNSFNSNMVCKVGHLSGGEQISAKGAFVALITEGHGVANDIEVKKGDLVQGEGLHFSASELVGLVVISSNAGGQHSHG